MRGRRAPEPGHPDKIRAPALSPVGHLAAEDCTQAPLVHAGAAQHAFALQAGRRRDHDDAIAAAGAPALEQQRDLAHGK